MASSRARSRERAAKDAEVESYISKKLKQISAACHVEDFVQLVYERAVVRYRRKNYLGASRDCDRATEGGLRSLRIG